MKYIRTLFSWAMCSALVSIGVLLWEPAHAGSYEMSNGAPLPAEPAALPYDCSAGPPCGTVLIGKFNSGLNWIHVAVAVISDKEGTLQGFVGYGDSSTSWNAFSGKSSEVDQMSWDSDSNTLSFRDNNMNNNQTYVIDVTGGTVTGKLKNVYVKPTATLSGGTVEWVLPTQTAREDANS